MASNDEMFITGKVLNILAAVFACTSIIVYSFLLLSIFWFKTIKKATELSLFYCHFAFDIICSFAMFLYMLTLFLSTTSFMEYFKMYPNFVFFIFWPMYVIGNTRAFLVLVIAMDRTFATYFPVRFYIYRKRISTNVIMIFVLFYSFFDIFVTFGLCQEVVNVPQGCMTLLCGMSLCYRNYWLNYEKVTYASTVFLSLLLSLKLFVWNKYKKQEVSRDLKRANRLALIDTVIIIIFDLIPPILVSTIPNFYYWLGPVNTVFKTLGFVIEGIWIGINLKKKSTTPRRKSSQIMTIVTGKGQSQFFH